MNKALIQKIALDSGFKLKEQSNGEFDLNPYVYEFANNISMIYQRDLQDAKDEVLHYKVGREILKKRISDCSILLKDCIQFIEKHDDIGFGAPQHYAMIELVKQIEELQPCIKSAKEELPF